MGKKKVTQQSTDSAFAEQARVDTAVGKSSVGSKKSKRIERGRIYVKASYNNTVVTVTDMKGDVITWATAGSLGFSGPKKATPFASSKVVAAIAERLKANGPTDVEVIVSGVGSRRESAIRSFINHGFNIILIKDVTPIPHNGPRPPKARRV
jgi:small subunit ribosomal protein S11